jgi:hypothetical protein
MHTLSNTLESLALGTPITSANLTMVPLLDEALDAGLAEVTAVSEGGAVPELVFRNAADRDILLVDGEELVGAKQNRVLNLTVLVAAEQQVNIPVSCVEAGRWAWRMNEQTRFESAYRATLYRVRAGTAPFDLRVDVASEPLAALMRQHGVATAAYLTACNPFSVQASEAANRATNERLRIALLQADAFIFHGEAIDPTGVWPAGAVVPCARAGAGDRARAGHALQTERDPVRRRRCGAEARVVARAQ